MLHSRLNLFLTCLGAGLLLSSLQPAHAQKLEFTLANPNPRVAPGSAFLFFATLQNLDSVNSISLDSSSFTFNTMQATLTDHFSNTPLSLNPQRQTGDSWTGDLFDVSVKAGVPTGTTLTGSYTIHYTDAGVASSALQNFVVTAVPELGTGIGMGLLMLGWAGWQGVRRRRRGCAARSSA